MSKIDDLGLIDCSKEESLKHGVYTIEHLCRPNIYYVGSTAGKRTSKNSGGFRTRWLSHYSTLCKGIHKNVYLQRVVNKYGIEGIRFKILEVTEPNIAVYIEQFWINVLGVTNKNLGYNLNPTATSTKGRILSDRGRINILQAANKRKGISFTNEGSFKKGVIPWNKGRKMNEAYSKNLQVKHKVGEKFYMSIKKRVEESKVTSLRVIVLDTNKNIVGIFRSPIDLVNFSKTHKGILPLIIKNPTIDDYIRSQLIYTRINKDISYKGLYFISLQLKWNISDTHLIIPTTSRTLELLNFVKNCDKNKGIELIKSQI